MQIDQKEIHRLTSMFRSCAPMFIALGDEVRQKLILDIAEGADEGINVTTLTAKNHLSRPAISHHLKVLKDCGLVKYTKKGTQIFYQVDMRDNVRQLGELVSSISAAMDAAEPAAV